MPRFEFDGRFYFNTQNARNQFGTAVQNYIDSHPTAFFGYAPINTQQTDHSNVLFRKVQARFTNRQELGSLFDDIKTQAINRGAVSPSSMWLKTVADLGGVTEGIEASAPGWVDGPVT